MAAAPASPPDYFAVFGLKRRFGIDLADLERRFYRLSRELHPDRFATAGADARRESLRKMSLVNEAYDALKDADARRDHLLRLEGAIGGADGEAARGQVPAELAESWFELQEALADDPGEARAKLEAFRNELGALKTRELDAIRALETRIDRGRDSGEGAQALLQELVAKIRARSYLQSMEKDVQRQGARLG